MDLSMKAIIDGNVLNSTGDRFIEKGVVLIEDNKIIAVGSPQEVMLPKEIEVIRAEGRYIVPGLIESHNHLYLDGPFKDQSLDPETEILHRGIRNARKQLRDGVTTLRDCGTPKFLDLEMKRLIEENLIPGPHLVCSGQWITSSNGNGSFPGTCSIADGPGKVRKVVREVLRHNVDFIKVMVSGGTGTPWTNVVRSYLGQDELKVLVDEAHCHERKVAAHIHGGPGVRFAVEAGIDTLEHGLCITDDREIGLIASQQIYWMFNIAPRLVDPDPNLHEYERRGVMETAKTATLAFQKAKKAGVKIIAGADGYHDDHACVWSLEALVKCGASPQEALLAGTLTAAEAIGLMHERGTLEPGKLADVLIVDENPLKNISALRNLRLIMKEGKVYSGL